MVGDLHLSVVDNKSMPPSTDTSRLSWATSIFYFGQLVGSYPMTYALQRCGTRHTLGPAVVVWAVICASTAGVSTWQGLLVQRFFLGAYFTSSMASRGSITSLGPKLTAYRFHRVNHTYRLHDHGQRVLHPV